MKPNAKVRPGQRPLSEVTGAGTVRRSMTRMSASCTSSASRTSGSSRATATVWSISRFYSSGSSVRRAAQAESDALKKSYSWECVWVPEYISAPFRKSQAGARGNPQPTAPTNLRAIDVSIVRCQVTVSTPNIQGRELPLR